MSKDRLKSPDWYAQMARVVDAQGSPGFVEALFAALRLIAPCQAITVFLYPRKGLPSALFEKDEEGPWLPEGNIHKYLEGYYLLCPFYRACMDGIGPGCYRLSDVALTTSSEASTTWRSTSTPTWKTNSTSSSPRRAPDHRRGPGQHPPPGPSAGQ